MTDEVVFFRLGLFLILVFALLDESADAYIGFWWFFFRLGLLYHLLFRIDVGLFFPRWACFVTIFFFFSDFSSKSFFGLLFFFFS